MGTVLYTHDKNDLERIIKKVINEVRKTELISTKSLTPEEDRLSQTQAAKFLGVSVTTLIKWKKQKKIPYYNIENTNTFFYSKTELLEFAKRNPELRRA